MAPAALCAAAAFLAVSSAPAATKPAPKPSPTASPLKVIVNVNSRSRLCVGLRRSVGPAISKVLQNDKTIAASRPLLQDYVKSATLSSEGGKDMAVARLESLVGPLVKNTQAIEQLLGDTVYASKAKNESDKQLMQIRAQLKSVLDQQKQALDLISGFVDTVQLGEMQSQGFDYAKAINGGTSSSGQGGANSPGSPTSAGTAPTVAPDPVLNAGVNGGANGGANDPTGSRKADPRFQTTNNALGYNPLSAFDQQMLQYQSTIAQNESQATISILHAVPACGGRVQAQPSPGPSGTP